MYTAPIEAAAQKEMLAACIRSPEVRLCPLKVPVDVVVMLMGPSAVRGPYEWGNSGKETDNDFHVIIGSSADPATATYMNVEVSGLPAMADDPNFTDLQNAREQLTGLAGHEPSDVHYEAFTPPLPVTVTGSLLYDGDHVPGEVGPIGHKPQTTWEIHPVTNIQQRQ